MGVMIGGVCTTQSANAKAACGADGRTFWYDEHPQIYYDRRGDGRI